MSRFYESGPLGVHGGYWNAVHPNVMTGAKGPGPVGYLSATGTGPGDMPLPGYRLGASIRQTGGGPAAGGERAAGGGDAAEAGGGDDDERKY